MRTLLSWAERGPILEHWDPPTWLLPHQVSAAKRIAAILRRFGGAVLADAVGMGKTYVALAAATRYRQVTGVVPAALTAQWHRVAVRVGVRCAILSHESLSRGARVPPADLIVVDEAHRLRNAATARYDRCARDIGGADVLLVTATPLVNRITDLEHLLRLFLADNALGFLGVGSLGGVTAPVEDAVLARAVSRLSVARPGTVLSSAGVPIPTVTDSAVAQEPAVEPRIGAALLLGIDGLTFPGVSASGGRHLLRAHLVHRLASSAAACRVTLRRHLAYVDRVVASAGDGGMRRATVRDILGPGDEMQFELPGLLLGADGQRPSTDAIEAERRRLLALLRATPRDGHANRKADRVRDLLERRRTARAIVFTSAAATAIDLARRLGWREVGVVAAGRARIASGPVSPDALLDAFAPRARGAPAPGSRGRVRVLIATDLVSEGLDLQDADTIVHYDLPWTPLRLAQRVGRIARLGAPHEVAHVIWFAPPPEYDRRIRLGWILAEKVRRQVSLAVPQTSRVGRSQVVNAMLDTRERLCRLAEDGDAAPPRGGPWLAVVRGPAALAAAIRWRVSGGDVPEMLVVCGSPPALISNHETIAVTLATLEGAPPSDHEIPAQLLATLFDVLRYRLRLAGRGPATPATVQLRRLVLKEGGKAGRARDGRALAALDRALDRLGTGCTVGAERELWSVLREGGGVDQVQAWLARSGRARGGVPDVRIVGLLAGDGRD